MSTTQEISPFNSNRLLALGIMAGASICAWYALLLMTSPFNIPLKPSRMQWLGGAISLVVVIMVWLRKCFTILPYAVVAV